MDTLSYLELWVGARKGRENKHASLLTILLQNTTCLVLASSVDPDQLAFEDANWSGSVLFVIKYVNFYKKKKKKKRTK